MNIAIMKAMLSSTSKTNRLRNDLKEEAYNIPHIHPTPPTGIVMRQTQVATEGFRPEHQIAANITKYSNNNAKALMRNSIFQSCGPGRWTLLKFSVILESPKLTRAPN